MVKAKKGQTEGKGRAKPSERKIITIIKDKGAPDEVEVTQTPKVKQAAEAKQTPGSRLEPTEARFSTPVSPVARLYKERWFLPRRALPRITPKRPRLMR